MHPRWWSAYKAACLSRIEAVFRQKQPLDYETCKPEKSICISPLKMLTFAVIMDHWFAPAQKRGGLFRLYAFW